MNSRKDVLEDKQCVILKGRRDGISILLDDKADFDLIKDVLRKRVAGSRNFFEGAKATVNFKGRKLTDLEEDMLLSIIQFEANLNIAVGPDDEPPGEAKLVPISPPGMNHIEMQSFYFFGGVRSGQVIQQNGSVVVIGDINPGGEIKATGNIVVLGSLKGKAWAGAPGDAGSGDASCFVSALDFQPAQIRIAQVVTIIPEEDSSQVPRGKGAWAYIQDGAMYIAPL